MKKFKSVLMCACFALLAVFAFVGCGDNKPSKATDARVYVQQLFDNYSMNKNYDTKLTMYDSKTNISDMSKIKVRAVNGVDCVYIESNEGEITYLEFVNNGSLKVISEYDTNDKIIRRQTFNQTNLNDYFTRKANYLSTADSALYLFLNMPEINYPDASRFTFSYSINWNGDVCTVKKECVDLLYPEQTTTITIVIDNDVVKSCVFVERTFDVETSKIELTFDYSKSEAIEFNKTGYTEEEVN